MSAALIALDWGTTNCRAFRLGADGAVLETRARPLGILAVRDGDWTGALAALAGDWLDVAPPAPVLMCGMIGSRQGWVEAPYADTPAGEAELAAGLTPVPLAGRRALIVPGVAAFTPAGLRDVMRGEETQVLGAAGPGRETLCLPGTHSKWVEVEDGRIARFATFLTGETYAVLRAHSILGRMMTGEAVDGAAFVAGFGRAADPGGLLHHLFGVRTAGLFGTLAPAAAPSYLSGLLIGHELRAATPAPVVTLVGTGALADLYETALRRRGTEVRRVDGEGAAARGLARIARRAGLLS